MPNRSHGFTLVELMVVVVVVAILAAVAMPSLDTALTNQRLRNAATDFVSALLLARSEAIKRGVEVQVAPLAPGDWTSGWRIATTADDDQVERTESLGHWVNVQYAPDVIAYQRSGRLVGAGVFAHRISRRQGYGRFALRVDRSIRHAPAHRRELHVRRNGIRGFMMIEVLIAVVILAFGLLALARAMATSTLDELESFQRSQAMVIAQEMVERINANRKEALSYVGSYAASSAIADCSLEVTVVLRDQCEFRNRLMGTGTRDAGTAIGSAIAARACIVESAPASNAYVVAIAWQGIKSTDAPDSSCGESEFDREENRRVFSTVLRIATLGT